MIYIWNSSTNKYFATNQFLKMKNASFLILALLIIFTNTFCSRKRTEKAKVDNLSNQEILSDQLRYVNTDEEIGVYNDFIDQVYNVYYCHLDMASPKEHFFKENVSKEIFNSYKKRFDQYLKRFNEMLDTSKIIAFVSDSLYILEKNPKYLISDLDSSQKRIFNETTFDTTVLKSAAFILDSLKSSRIYFERRPYKYIDWDKMPIDSALKYSDQNDKYWFDHVGKQINSKYYIGSISMSRVKFNHDSTLCFLECGYTAQSKCGYGHYYFLRKIKNKWIVVTSKTSWVS
jgi:hypothetical protein